MARALILVLSLLLASCASYTPAPSATGVSVRPASEFIAHGKLGIRSQSVNETARFVWIQQGPDYEIELLDPFGRQIMDLIGEPGQVILRTDEADNAHTAQTPELLMQRLLGWQVPVSPARYWIQGHPAPGISFDKRSDTVFHQLDWSIELLELQQTEAGLVVPRKVRLTNNELQLTLIINEWRFSL